MPSHLNPYRFHTNVRGIPCICEVTHYNPGTNHTINSASLEPNEPEDFEFRILDLNYQPAPGIEELMGFFDESKLKNEYLEEVSDNDF